MIAEYEKYAFRACEEIYGKWYKRRGIESIRVRCRYEKRDNVYQLDTGRRSKRGFQWTYKGAAGTDRRAFDLQAACNDRKCRSCPVLLKADRKDRRTWSDQTGACFWLRHNLPDVIMSALPPPILVQKGGVWLGNNHFSYCRCRGWCNLPLHHQMVGRRRIVGNQPMV